MPSVDILANTRQAQSNVKDLSKAMDGVGDSLDDLVSDSVRGGERIERSFRDMANEAKKADTAIEKVGDGGERGFRKASEASTEFKDEALSNFSEVTSSFDGSMSSVQDLAQGTLGGLASSGLPGIGIAAGVAAAGVGLIGASLVAREEEAHALRDRMVSIYQDAAAAGQEYLPVAAQIAESQDLMFNPDRAAEWKRVQDTQKQTGIDMATILQANAGDLESIEIVQGRINGLIDEQIAKNIENGRGANYSRELQTVEDHWGRVGSAADEASAKADDAIRYTSDLLLRAARDAGTATQEVDEFGNKLLTLPEGEQIVIDAKTGQAHQDLARFKGDLDGITETVATAVLKIDDTAVRTYRPPKITIQGDLVLPNGLNRRALIQ